jgi:hypothetical protein
MISNCDEARRNGGPAFPSTQYANGISPYGHSEGMTLRDYFAAKALCSPICLELSSMNNWDNKTRADWSYVQADAMLKARQP